MKGSGFSLQGILYIFFVMLMLAIFISASLYIGFNVKKIALEETIIDKTKESMEIIDTTLDPTFSISFVQSVFAAGQGGFGKEYWYRRASPGADAITSIPAKEDVEAGLSRSMLPYLALPGTKPSGKTIELDGVNVEIRDILPEFAADMENGKITSRIGATIKAFSGLENDRRTEMAKRVKKENTASISLAKLMDSGKSLVSRLSSLAIKSYSGHAAAYADSASAQIKKIADDTPLSTKASMAESRLVVPETLSGLYLHYSLRSEFLDDNKANAYDYLDEEKNMFEKRPFSLAVKAEDYVVALNCAANSGLHKYSADNDMACGGGKIYSCNTVIEGIGTNLLGCGGSTGKYGCGEAGFKDSGSVDISACYCAAFGGKWEVPAKPWECPKTDTRESAEPIPNWDCSEIKDKDGRITGYKCTTTVKVVRPCEPECDLGGMKCKIGDCSGI